MRLGLILIALGLALAGCGPRPVGDFGRAAPGVVHDSVMPAAGGVLARMRGDPVSSFNLTDEEREMHARTWRFVVAAHANDWAYDFTAELERTRIAPVGLRQFGTERYYRWLTQTHYQSSRVRYRTLERHVLADLDTLPGTFASICAVLAIDAQRRAALAGLSRLDPRFEGEARARAGENALHIGRFVAALDYRHRSYAYALDHLLVETPHAESLSADRALARLAPFVERARRGAFCVGHGAGQAGKGGSIPSRYAHGMADSEVIAIK